MTGITKARTIDIHAHAVLEETMGAAGSYGPELTVDGDGRPLFRVGSYQLLGVKYRGSPFMDLDLRIAAMDRAGIDFQVLSPNPLTYFHFIPTPEAIRFCQHHNDVLAALVKRYPERLAGFAALPMQDPAAAAKELKRATQDLGLLGAYVGTEFGIPLDSKALDNLYQTFVDLDVPLFLHPSPAGIDGPAGDPALKRFDLDLVAGFAAQETLAVATMIFGGVLERHPALDICISHGAGAVPFLIGRLALAGRKRPWAPAYLQKEGAFEEYLSRFWFDIHVNDQRALDYLISIVGQDHLVLGTNFAGWDSHDVHHQGELAGRLADNARRLLRVGGAVRRTNLLT
jgi:aminocarboxymuconate-semialdehyde decarboxylase